ncbi:PAS domain-containing sensor histidine kinase [Flaviaesturariibacter terrae]
MNVLPKVAAPFLKGGGEMGRLIRNTDWANTSLGRPEDWPVGLQTTVSILLNSQFPMFIWWGPELITIYNDSYIPIAGEKHPKLLGQSGKEGWSEIWNDLGPLVDSVFGGTSTWSEDQLLLINRRGYVEETYFTFSYSPVLDGEGQVAGLFCACIETTEKVQASRRIQESERNLRNTILQSPVAMCILRGPDHIVEIANDRMFALWGRGGDELLRRPIFEGLPEVRHQGFEELLQGVLRTGESFVASERSLRLPRGSGTETVYANFVYEPFREGDGSISGIIAVAIDVTDQVLARQRIEEVVVERTGQLAEVNRALSKSNEDLLRTNTNLEEFAYAASHDLKEPIRKIHFFADRLRSELDAKLDEGQKSLFSRLEQASRRMGALIDDLLGYSQVTRGAAQQEEVDLSQRLDQVLHDLEIEQKNVRIDAGPLPVIRGNGRQFQQLLQNLVANAIKYSRPGVPPELQISSRIISGAGLRARVPAAEEGQCYHLIEVSDNGIGFEPKDAERMFQVFTRLHGHAERGTGIGLSIVRKVVDNHQGHVWAEGTPGAGASFFILLPINK